MNKKEAIHQLLTRGVDKIYPSRAALEKALLSGKKLRLYNGVDPSGPDLHIGHGVVLQKLKEFQDLGHEVIWLVGDFTALSGDPDKTQARKMLTKQEVAENLKSYQKQAEKILTFSGKNAVKLKFNNDWLGKLTFSEVVEIASHFTVQRMLERDLFERRIKVGSPIRLHEFLYPLMQAYDCIEMDVDLEVGGTDQTFNMLAGRDLMKSMKNKEKFVLTLKLLEDPTGKKMGKTEGNMVILNDKPEEMFGKIMSWTDAMIIDGFESCTRMPMQEVNEVAYQLKHDQVNPRDAKARLAKEIVTIYHDEKAGLAAEEHFRKVFQKGETPEEVKTKKLSAQKLKVVDLFVQSGLCSSNAEVKRLIQQKGLYINGAVVRDKDAEVVIGKDGLLLKKGKRHFVKIIR